METTITLNHLDVPTLCPSPDLRHLMSVRSVSHELGVRGHQTASAQAIDMCAYIEDETVADRPWAYIPKFGNDTHHSQRWRPVT
jgi:hypothetical protein